MRVDGSVSAGNPQSLATPSGTTLLKGNVAISARTAGLGADYTYYLDGSSNSGPCLGAGLVLASNQLRLELPGLRVDPGETKEETSTGLGYGLYVGCQFTRPWQADLSFRASQFHKTLDDGDDRYSMPVLTLAAGIAF